MFYKSNPKGVLLKKYLFNFLLFALFFFLLLFPQDALAASKSGILLWYDSLLPTLLPFLILSQLLLKSSASDAISAVLGPICGRIFHCSDKGVFCVLCGFLCGYPVGARLIALQVREKQLSAVEGQYLLSFCNNVSPAFCISCGILQAIGSTRPFPYLCIIYGAPILFGLLTRPPKMSEAAASIQKQTSPSENIFRLIDVCIIDSFSILLKLCGYLVLFSVVSHCLGRLLPDSLSGMIPMLTAFLEVTNGLSLIGRLPSGTWRTAMAVAALSFGGLCCILQTSSVIEGSGLSLKKYILHKLLTAVLSLFLFFLLLLLRHLFL